MTRPRTRLLFDGKHVRLIIDGKQTAAVRPASTLPPCRVGDLVPVLKTAALGSASNAGARRVCSVRVHTVDQVPLSDVDLKTARACGYRTTADWRHAWLGRHDPHAQGLADVDPAAPDVTSRWDQAWAGRTGWLLRFRFEPDLDERFIAQGVAHETDEPERSNGARGYTTNPALAIPGEPPAVDDATLERYAHDARRRHAERAATSGDAETRLAALRVLAARRGIDISKDERVIIDRINKLERRLSRPAS